MKTKKSLTVRALDILNAAFATGNPYSRTRWEWKKYIDRNNRLQSRLKNL